MPTDPTTQPNYYKTGHVKYDPETLQVAIRSIFNEEDPMMVNQAWLIATTSRGAYFVPTRDVQDWTDLHTPPES